MKAIDASMRLNLRRMRAEPLAAHVLRAIEPFLDREEPRAREDAFYALLGLFMEKGVEVLTDLDREKAGLAPRDGEGWTSQEIAVFEAMRLEAMMRPIKHLIPADKLVGDAGIEPATSPV